MRAMRDVMVLSPPLVIAKAEINELVEAARPAFDQTAEKLRT